MMNNKEEYGGTFRPDGFVSLNMIVDNMIKKGEYPQIKSYYSAEWLKTEISKAVEEGYTDFITGMARGVDIWAAEDVLRLKEEGADPRLIAASAFK